jgi:lysophospholipase L1-like esterase
MAGLLYASNFGQWQVPQGNLGTYSWNSYAYCYANTVGVTFQAFTMGTPIKIVDVGNPSATEIVTPSAVSIVPPAGLSMGSCSITIAPANPHSNYYYTSATAGLQEAINWAKTSTNTYDVVLTPDWTTLGGTTAMVTAASGNFSTPIIDERTGSVGGYSWNGSQYTPIGVACTGYGSSQTCTITGNLNVTGTLAAAITNSPKVSSGGVSSYTTACWGDSITQAVNGMLSYCYDLQFLLGTGTINEGYPGDWSANVLARFQSTPTAPNYVTIIMVGVNDIANGVTNATIEANIASIVSAVTSGNYLVLSTTNTTAQPSGSGGYIQLTALNSYLSTTYGSKFLDVRSLLVAAYNPLNPTDVTNYSQDVPPSSLRVDGTHFNTAGNAIIANAVNTKLRSLYPSIYTNGPTTIPPTTLTSQNQGLPITNSLVAIGTLSSDLAPLGAELTSSSGWTSTGWTGSYSAGFLHTTGNTNALSYPVAITAGLPYMVAFTVSSGSVGTVTASLGGASIVNTTDNQTAFYGPQYVVIAGPYANTTAGLILTPTTDFNGTISAISVKQITSAVANAVWSDSTMSDSFELRTPLANMADIFMGYKSGLYTTQAQQDVAIGYWSMQNNTTGGYDACVGALCLQHNQTGANNACIGQGCLSFNTLGSYNACVGTGCLQQNIDGSNNVGAGFRAGYYVQHGGSNTSIGNAANSSGDTNNVVAVGASAAQLNQSSGVTAIGFSSFQQNTTGGGTAVGYKAAQENTTGTNVDAFGAQALLNNNASNVAAFGAGAMSANLNGIDNAAFGTNSSSSNLHGSNNASFGVFSLQSSTGDSDTCMGENCLGNNTSGTANTAMGLAAGVTETPANSNVSGSQNTWIGANSGPGTTTQLSNTCALGYESHPTQNNQCTIGSNTTTLATLYGAMQWPSYTTAGTLQTDASGNVSSTGKLPPLSGVSGSIGGSSVASGGTAAGTVTIIGVTAGMPCFAVASDGTAGAGYPFVTQAYGTGVNTANVVIWNFSTTSQTPTAKTYNVRCIP